jgi:hypothetical protein
MGGRYFRDTCITHVAHWIADQGQNDQPDRAQAELFLNRLDSEDNHFSFRTFSDSVYTRTGSGDPLEKALHGSLSSCWHELKALNQSGAVITVTINRTNGYGRSVQDIERVRALFIDDDHGIDPALFKIHPHIQASTSPGHANYYWLVKDLALCQFQVCQQRLAECYAGDRRVQALNQAMQLPGFWRRKRLNTPRLSKVTAVSEAQPLDRELIKKLLSG